MPPADMENARTETNSESPRSVLARLPEGTEHTIRIFLANRMAVFGLLILLFWMFIAVAGPAIAPYHYEDQNLFERLKPPSAAHWMGTDWLGRDVFSIVLWGARITLLWGLLPIVVTMLLGVPAGAIAGFFGGWPRAIIMRLSDLFLAIPSLLLAIAITAALSPSLFNAMVAISIVWWPSYSRLVEAQTLSLKEEVFVDAARGLGASRLYIIIRHILPNCLPMLLVRGSMDIGFSILYMAALGFIGLGAQPPTPEWGVAVSSGRSYMPEYWWVSLFAGLAVFSVVLGCNLVGDGIRDAVDPKIRGR